MSEHRPPSTTERIREICLTLDRAGKWPSETRCRTKGMRSDGPRFREIRDDMRASGELHTEPPRGHDGPKNYLHPPLGRQRRTAPAQPKPPWRPKWAANWQSRLDIDLEDIVASLKLYLAASQRFATFPKERMDQCST